MIEHKNKQEKIMKIFFNSPSQRFHVRELSRLTKISVSTVSRVIKELLKKYLLVIRRKTPILELEANLNSKKFISNKKEFNIHQIKEVGLLDFIIEKYNEPEAIILFGSYSKGEDFEKSDIDILVVTSKKINSDLEKYEKLLKRKIHFIEMNIKEIKPELLNNIINGIILYGYLKLK